MSAKSIVAKLRDLAAVPQNRATIVQDQGCLPGLILFLDQADRSVVVLALQALQYLSLCDSNRSIMVKELGLLVSLNVLMKTGSIEEQTLAVQIKQNLESPSNATKPATQPTRSPLSAKHPKTATNKTLQTGGSFISKQNLTSLSETSFLQPQQNSFFVGVQNYKAKTVILQLHGFNDTVSQTMVEEALLAVRGVISFTCDMNTGRVTVRTKTDLSVDTLFSAVLNVDEDLAPRQVVKNISGEEIFLEPALTAENDDENEPQYLEEDSDEDENTARRSALTRKDGKSSLSSDSWFDGITSFARSWWG